MVGPGIIASAKRPSGGGADPFTFRYNGENATDATSYTFTSVPLGTASASRRAIVWINLAALNIPITGVTIDGVAATMDWDSGNTLSNRRGYLWSAVVPTGTSGDIVVTFSGNCSRIGIGVWTIPSGSFVGQVSATNTTLSGTLNLTTVAGDYCIAGAMSTGTGGTISCAWTGAVTERYDQTYEGTINAHTGADVVASGTTTSATYTFTGTTGSHNTPKVFANYR